MTRVLFSFKAVDPPRSSRRLRRPEEISGFNLTAEGPDTLKHLPWLRVLWCSKAYSDGKAIDASLARPLESFALEGSWKYLVTDCDLQVFVGSKGLLSLESSGLVKISPSLAAQWMNNSFLR